MSPKQAARLYEYLNGPTNVGCNEDADFSETVFKLLIFPVLSIMAFGGVAAWLSEGDDDV